MTRIPDESATFSLLEQALGKSWERVPTCGYWGTFFGVPTLYALLAYPDQSEQKQREGFRDALRAIMLKNYIAHGGKRPHIPTRYRRYKNEKLFGTLKKGFKRIGWRLMAGSMGFSICANGMRRSYESLGLVPSKEGKRGVVFRGPKSVNEAVASLMSQRRAKGEWVGQDSEATNIKHRIWAGSLPVLHLAIAMHQRIETLPGDKDIDKLRQCLYPPDWLKDWLQEVLIYAEYLRTILPSRFPSFGRGNTVRLLPIEETCQKSCGT